ncbi:hypothetical protein D3C87_1838680 [compost metagenome]
MEQYEFHEHLYQMRPRLIFRINCPSQIPPWILLWLVVQETLQIESIPFDAELAGLYQRHEIPIRLLKNAIGDRVYGRALSPPATTYKGCSEWS